MCHDARMEKFLHAVNCAVGGDRRVLRRWWDEFADWRVIWERPELEHFRQKFDVEREFARLWDQDIVVIGRTHSDYPTAMLHFADAPFLLYRKGAVLNDGARKIAVVGTRRASAYGRDVAYDLAEALALGGVTVVSGLAFGIDAVAHFAAVSSRKPTIAVLGSGLFDVTPSSHRRLAAEILAQGGTLLSEYPPGDPAFAGRFLERNRIIAGLCEATVVIEAGVRSGALATARLANEYGKSVHALVADIKREQAQGCLQLIYDGATPLVNIQKFVEDLKLEVRLTPAEIDVLAAFEGRAYATYSTDELAEKTLQSIGVLNALLAQLELKSLVRRNRRFLWELVPEPEPEPEEAKCQRQSPRPIPRSAPKLSPPSLF